MSDTEYISKDAFIAQQRKQYCEDCERRKGVKNGKRKFVYEIGEAPCRACDIEDMIDAVWDFLPAEVAPVHNCSTCGKNAYNGGVCENGKTKCPIQEHYVLPRDGFCHLYSPVKTNESEDNENG